MNVLKTGLLLSLLTVLLVAVGHLIGGPNGAAGAFLFALVINLLSYWFSDKLVLAMYQAKPLREADAPLVYRVVREIAMRDRIPMPKLYLLPTRTPNAFATGRDPKHAAVAVTSGLLEIMSEEELTGVLAHELSHVKNRDTLVMSIVAAVAGAIMMLRNSFLWHGGRRSNGDDNRNAALVQLALFVVFLVVVPLVVLMIQLAISRTREFGADETGARLTRNPNGLASALQKLESAAHAHPLPDANPATAHLFIVNPLTGGGIAKLFSTHPSIEERVQRLRSMRI